MKKHLQIIYLLLFFTLIFSTADAFSADSLSIDTTYRIRGLNYKNTFFRNDGKPNPHDSKSFYSQRLNIDILRKFDTNLEIGTKLTSIGVSGSTYALTSASYPNTLFSPFMETAYLKVYDILKMPDLPIDFTVGKQNMEFGDGLIVSDNGAGFNAFRIHIHDVKSIFIYPFEKLTAPITRKKVKKNKKKVTSDTDSKPSRSKRYLKKVLSPFDYAYKKINPEKGLRYVSKGFKKAFTFLRIKQGATAIGKGLKKTMNTLPGAEYATDIFSAKVSENYDSASDHDISGIVTSFTASKHRFELAYFSDSDKSGSTYDYLRAPTPSNSIIKNFLDFRIIRKEKEMEYTIEVVKQSGSAELADNTSVDLNAFAYTLSGCLIGEKTKLGKVKAIAAFSYFSGDQDQGDLSSDNRFNPRLTKQFDGLERAGKGYIFGATPQDSLFPIPDTFSGLNTFTFGTEFSPIYGWDFEVIYYLYSASQGPAAAPKTTGLEQILGSKFKLGLEMDLGAKYTFSDRLEIRFAYCRYTPPKGLPQYWPSAGAKDRTIYYKLETVARF